MINKTEQKIIDLLEQRGACSSKEIFDDIEIDVSYASIKRILAS